MISVSLPGPLGSLSLVLAACTLDGSIGSLNVTVNVSPGSITLSFAPGVLVMSVGTGAARSAGGVAVACAGLLPASRPPLGLLARATVNPPTAVLIACGPSVMLRSTVL